MLDVIPDHRRNVAIDGGAHTGTWTEVLAQEFEAVHAFEPHPDLAAKIPELETIEVYVHALGAKLERADLVAGDDNEGQYHLMPGDGTWIVPLDAYGLENVDFLKLDVEGFEAAALNGAKETLDRCSPWVMIEENGLAHEYYGQDPQGAHKRLRQWGYRRVGAWNRDMLYAP